MSFDSTGVPFFQFLDFLVDLIKKLFNLLTDNRIASFFGISLLSILVGLWMIKIIYNIFLSHPTSFSRVDVGDVQRASNAVYLEKKYAHRQPAGFGSTDYSSAYKGR